MRRVLLIGGCKTSVLAALLLSESNSAGRFHPVLAIDDTEQTHPRKKLPEILPRRMEEISTYALSCAYVNSSGYLPPKSFDRKNDLPFYVTAPRRRRRRS